MAQNIPPQTHKPVYAWAGADETISAPRMKAGVVKTIAQFMRGLPEIEPHHLVIFDSKAG